MLLRMTCGHTETRNITCCKVNSSTCVSSCSFSLNGILLLDCQCFHLFCVELFSTQQSKYILYEMQCLLGIKNVSRRQEECKETKKIYGNEPNVVEAGWLYLKCLRLQMNYSEKGQDFILQFRLPLNYYNQNEMLVIVKFYTEHGSSTKNGLPNLLW